ncbi:Crp/Fnr family transcriptional regulator [Elizabethkingia sp. JS20170427COW]|uniref:Crp/Fnr family transcriptional regulator n=1 Tax=Elizabethkingia sp. JS20170427COW TaxID=2583851 RepID=UPI0011108036|nr:Crp/Fnr family transcriptional regulator [Elizabethkingia sp. JS20170427COW]QCX53896.1 Crp/Fnr family transcriptional regulator [Elizabethkingia sp. JS20170427COW]
MIPESLLQKYQGKIKEFQSGDFIFREGTYSHNYFQILEGKVKLNNYSDDGKEFIQNIIEAPHCFGETFLFLKELYPINAIAIEKSKIIEVPNAHFSLLLTEHPNYAAELNKNMAERMYFKMLMSQNFNSRNSENRLKTLLDYFKHTHQKPHQDEYIIPLTRQQIANITGLCVETVIRSIKNMERKGMLRIRDRKIYY